MASVIARESAGFDKCSQRRGVTPLVLLLNRSGNISARSLTVIVRSSSEWMAATPFVLCEPTIARFAIRILRCGVSSTRLTRSTRPSSPGKRLRTESSRRRLISRMISRCRGSRVSNHSSGHFSSASGSSVWFVYANVLLRQVPSLIPTEMHVVEQDAHQLGHRHARVRVVELDGDLVR